MSGSFARLAVAPIGWSNDDLPELGGDTPLERCLAESRAAGFCATELGGKFPRDAATLRPLLNKHNLRLASGWFSGLLCQNDSVDEEWRRILPQLQCFAALGTTTLFYADTTGSVQARRDTPLSARPRIAAADFAAYGRKLTALAARMNDEFGIRMAYHHHMGTLIESPADVDALMDSTGDAVGLLVDSGHIAFAVVADACRNPGGAPSADSILSAIGSGAALLRQYAARTRYIHCKDLRRAPLEATLREDKTFIDAVLDGVFTVPGDGFLDFAAFIRAVADINYHGWLVVEAEQDPARANPLDYSRMGGQHLRDCCAAAGVAVIADDRIL